MSHRVTRAGKTEPHPAREESADCFEYLIEDAGQVGKREPPIGLENVWGLSLRSADHTLIEVSHFAAALQIDKWRVRADLLHTIRGAGMNMIVKHRYR